MFYVELKPGWYGLGMSGVSGTYPIDYIGQVISDSMWLLDE